MTGIVTKLLALGLLALSCLLHAPDARAKDGRVLFEMFLPECSDRIEDAYRDRRMLSIKRHYPETYDLAIIQVMERCMAFGANYVFDKHRPIDLIHIAAKRRSIDEDRKFVKHVTIDSEDEETLTPLTPATEGPLSTSEIKAAKHLSLLLLKALKREDFEAHSHYLSGLHHKETADLLKSTEAAIQQRVSRTTDKIRSIVTRGPEFSGHDKSGLSRLIALALFLACCALGIAGFALGGTEDFLNAMSGKRQSRNTDSKTHTPPAPPVTHRTASRPQKRL